MKQGMLCHMTKLCEFAYGQKHLSIFQNILSFVIDDRVTLYSILFLLQSNKKEVFLVNQASFKQFSAKELLCFAFPSIIMMIFLSLYTIVDGYFVSRFVSTTALSAINITFPLTSLFLGGGIMFATGGSAIVAIRMGEGEYSKANSDFSLIACFCVGATVVGIVLCLLFLEPILSLAGANAEIMPLCKEYITVLLLFFPTAMIQLLFQNFFVTASRPGLGLLLTVGAGCANMILDYIFIAHFQMGIGGAAWATVIGYCVPAVGGSLFFFQNKNGLHFSIPKWDPYTIIKSCANGVSEMMTNLSTGITILLFNLILMRMVGEDGVATITVIMYCQFLMTALFMGFSIGVAPVFSFHFGAGNFEYLKKTKRICFALIGISSIFIFLISFGLSEQIAAIFSPSDSQIYELIHRGMSLFSFAFIFAGLNIFISALFTAISNGKLSAIISFSRTLLFIVLGIIVLTAILGVDGLWLSVPFAEVVTAILVLFLNKKHLAFESATLE